jgi:hypothetical protein
MTSALRQGPYSKSSNMSGHPKYQSDVNTSRGIGANLTCDTFTGLFHECFIPHSQVMLPAPQTADGEGTI